MTRTAVVVNAPKNLIVHVNRSKWDVEKGQLVKDNRSIEFDPILELPGKSNSWPDEIKNMSKASISGSSRRYGLYGIVVHEQVPPQNWDIIIHMLDKVVLSIYI